MDTKICSKCRITKTIDSFHKSPRNKDGRAGLCKECAKVRARQHYHRNIDKIHAYRRNEYIKNRDKLLNKGRLWQQKTIDSWRDYFPKTSCQVCGKELILEVKQERINPF